MSNKENITTNYNVLENGQIGEVRIADEVVAIIAGLAATEVKGVASMAGNVTNELVSKLGMKNLSKGVKVVVTSESVSVDMALNMEYGYSIPKTSKMVQEKVKQAIEIGKERSIDCVIGFGGGSAIDVAKCIKLYSNMDTEINYLEQLIIPNEVKLLVVPTTAGSGSEATRYAVIYYKGEKQSVTHESCIPALVLVDASVLETLPEYQRKNPFSRFKQMPLRFDYGF